MNTDEYCDTQNNFSDNEEAKVSMFKDSPLFPCLCSITEYLCVKSIDVMNALVIFLVKATLFVQNIAWDIAARFQGPVTNLSDRS